MTYTRYRSTQDTLQTLDSLELDTVRSTSNDILKKFDWEYDSHFMATGQLKPHQRIRLMIWQIFEEPRSSKTSKVSENAFRFSSI